MHVGTATVIPDLERIYRAESHMVHFNNKYARLALLWTSSKKRSRRCGFGTVC